MTTDSSENTTNPESAPRVIDLDELRRQRICKKRYGRATLTINRWGSLGLIGDRELGHALTRFRDGKASASELAWAFVRARIEGHSPSFRFESADLDRLIDLVTDCSRSPHFKAKTVEALAEEVIAADDKQREEMRELTQQFSKSISAVTSLSKAFQPSTFRVFDEQRKTMAALAQTFSTPRFTALPGPTIHERMVSLGLSQQVRSELFPTLQAMKKLQLATTPSVGLLAQRIRLPDTFAGEISKSLTRSLGVYDTTTLPPGLATLAREQATTLSDVVRAGQEAADLIEGEEGRAEAQKLRVVSAEVAAVAEDPRIEKVEQVVVHLAEEMNARFDELKEQDERHEADRQRDRRDDVTLAVYFVFLQVYLALFLFMLQQLAQR